MTTTKTTRFLFLTSTPQLAGKARQFGASYRRMAIVEVDADLKGRPKMISTRAKGVVQIVEEAVHSIGKTDRSLGFREMARMEKKTATLNAK